MIFSQCFKEHITRHPKVAIAFEEFKPFIKEALEKWPHTAANHAEWYKNAISNFMHGAFRCTAETEIITSWGQLQLRTANINDYDFIDAAERDKDCTSWVNNWPLGSRIEKFGDNNFFQTMIQTHEGRPVGFIDFRDIGVSI